jgi:hypothetical protein
MRESYNFAYSSLTTLLLALFQKARDIASLQAPSRLLECLGVDTKAGLKVEYPRARKWPDGIGTCFDCEKIFL